MQAIEVRMAPDSPISSLAAARDAVRAERKRGENGPARVVIADGHYALKEAVVFGPEDGATTYEAVPGASPVISGGERIDGWMSSPEGFWITKVNPAWRFESLWVNGQRATRARTPNEGFLQALGQPTDPLPGVTPTGESAKTMLRVDSAATSALGSLTRDELNDVNASVYFSWDMQRYRVAAVRASDGTLQFTGPLFRAFFSLEPFHAVRLENYRTALDAPGEWFLARDGTLTYFPKPGENIAMADIWAPVASQWMIIKGDAEKQRWVRDLYFNGLRFEHQSWTLPPGGAAFGQAEMPLNAAIELDGAQSISFVDCRFQHTSTNGLWARNACRDVSLTRCLLADLGAGGVKIGEGSVAANVERQTSNVSIDNCIIRGGGRLFPGAIGVWIGHSGDNKIRHCDIADFFYTAISIGWTWGYTPGPCRRNLVDSCHLHHLGWGVMSDMGAVYTLGPQEGTVIRGCHVHDISCASYGGWGLYNDEGSTGSLWENNLVYRTQGGGYHQHYGRGNVIRNNIFAFSQDMQIRRSRLEDFLAFTFENNIVLFSEGALFGHVDQNWFDGRVSLARNVYWKTNGQPFDFAGKSWEEWRLWGNDTESVIADPRFTAPEKGDWTMAADSPAVALGFKPFDWRSAGVTGDEAWRNLAAAELPAMVFPKKREAPPLSVEEGFESVEPGGRPLQLRIPNPAPELAAVTSAEHSHGKQCLQLSDGPNVQPDFDPHVFYQPNHREGTTRVAFDVKCERGYHLVHEWRDDAQPYRTGPTLEFRDGAVFTSGRRLADFPVSTWVHVEMRAKLGDDSDAKWDCEITKAGGQPERFENLSFANPGMRKLDWLGFASVSQIPAKAWLDDISIQPQVK